MRYEEHKHAHQLIKTRREVLYLATYTYYP